MMLDLGTFCAAYLIGSVPFGLLLTKLAGLGDIRQIGSGNIGATNVLRTGRKGLAALTLSLDGAKGLVAVLLFSTHAPAAAVGALVGHIFPVWLKGRGGKGVATYIGVTFGLSPLLGGVACGAWLATAFTMRISSLSALVMLGVVPLVAWFLIPPLAPLLAVLSLLVVFRHKDNLRRLLNGTEPKIGQKKS